jgi:branched-chain amino acid transport system ATP-binding protein
LLELSDVHAGYGAGRVLHGVTLRAEAGEVVAVLGPNGAGKTTLLRAISGVIPDVTGPISLDGRSLDHVASHRRVRRGVVHVPEGRANVVPALTVTDNLRLCGGAPTEIGDLFPVLRDRHDQVAGTLSGGQQQMLAIALGLALRPRVLLIDEPSAGLAPGLVDEVFARLAGLRGSGMALVVAEQRVDLAVEIADRGYVLESGRISVSGSMTELRDSPILRGSYLGA